MMSHRLRPLVLAASLAASFAAFGACSDDPTDPGPGSGSGSSAVVVFERVFSPSGRLYYASVLPEMPTSGTIDRGKAREFTSADVEAFDGALFIRDRTSNVMTRFSVSSDRQLVQQGQFSFQNVGLPTRRFQTAYLSPTRAYLIDNVGWRLIEWNPAAMALTGNQVSIEHMKKDGLPDSAITPPVRVGDRIIAGVSWQDSRNLVIHPALGAMIIDPASSSPPPLIEETRLGSANTVSAGANGEAFLTGVVYGIELFGSAAGGQPVPPSGVAKIAAGASQFDTAEVVNVTAITGSPGVYAIHRIDARFLLVQMWDPATPTDAYTSADTFLAASEYIFAIVDTQAKTCSRVESIPKGGAGNTLNHVVDNKLYVQLYEELGDGVSDAIVHAATPTGIAPAFRIPSGDLWFVTRIR